MAANTVELHHVARDMCAYNHIVNATLHKLLLCQHKIFSRITENNIVFFLCRCVIAFQPETVITLLCCRWNAIFFHELCQHRSFAIPYP